MDPEILHMKGKLFSYSINNVTVALVHVQKSLADVFSSYSDRHTCENELSQLLFFEACPSCQSLAKP